jgi:hypothetical protein
MERLAQLGEQASCLFNTCTGKMPVLPVGSSCFCLHPLLSLRPCLSPESLGPESVGLRVVLTN